MSEGGDAPEARDHPGGVMEAVVDTAQPATHGGEPPGAIRPIAGWGLERGVDEAVGADRRDHSGHVGHLHAHRRHVAARDDVTPSATTR